MNCDFRIASIDVDIPSVFFEHPDREGKSFIRLDERGINDRNGYRFRQFTGVEGNGTNGILVVQPLSRIDICCAISYVDGCVDRFIESNDDKGNSRIFINSKIIDVKTRLVVILNRDFSLGV